MADWLQAGGNAARTSFTLDVLGPNLPADWRYDFANSPLGFHERVSHRVQVVVSGGVLIVPTTPGRVYGFQATAPTDATRATGWPTAGYVALGAPAVTTPALDATYAHAPTLDGNVHAVTLGGGVVHHTYAGAHGGSKLGPITAAPTLVGGQLILVDHRGQVTSLNPATYAVNWVSTVTTSGDLRPVPLRMTPCADGTRLIIGRMDMHVTALHLSDGTLAWRTDGPTGTLAGQAFWTTLTGAAFLDYWPVYVAAAGAVILRPVPLYGDNEQRSWAGTNPLYRGVPVDDWLTTANQTARLAEVDANPARFAPTLHVLDAATGALRPYPIHWAWNTWMHGPGAPVAITHDNQVVIQARVPASINASSLGGHALLDVTPASPTYRQVTTWLGAYGNRDENMTSVCAAHKIVNQHTLGFNNANIPVVYDRDTSSWVELPPDTSGATLWSYDEPSGAPSPTIVATGGQTWMYHIASNQLAARNTT